VTGNSFFLSELHITRIRITTLCSTPLHSTTPYHLNRLRIPFFILLGLALGIGLGLIIGWIAWPTEFTDANPAVLQENYRRDYILMIADAYALDGNLAAARQRLDSLGEDADALLLDIVIDAILRQQNEAQIRRLTQLADDLGLYTPAMAPYVDATATPELAP